jgi:hypothetical protein
MLFEIISVWQVVVACLAFMLIMPVIFYLASLNRSAPKIKMKMKKRRVDVSPTKNVEDTEE